MIEPYALFTAITMYLNKKNTYNPKNKCQAIYLTYFQKNKTYLRMMFHLNSY